MSTPLCTYSDNVNVVHELATERDPESAVCEFYNRWAETYDKQASNSKYLAPKHCAKALGKVLTDKAVYVIDICSGTGMAGQELARLGFKRIDAVDFSQGMLDISASKGVYERLMCQNLGSKPIDGVINGHYDAIICSGALSIGHLTHEIFPEWNRILKTGGFISFSLSWAMTADDPKQHVDTVDTMRDAIDDLLRRGVWELIEKVDLPIFDEYSALLYTIRKL